MITNYLKKDLMGKLVEQVSKAESTDYQKEAALEAIGYICSDIVSFATYLFTIKLVHNSHLLGIRLSYLNKLP